MNTASMLQASASSGRRTLVPLLLALALATGIGIALDRRAAVASVDNATADLRRREAALTAHWQARQKALAASAKPTASATPAAKETLSSSPAPSASATPAPAAKPVRGFFIGTLFQQQPELRALYIGQEKASYRLDYGPLVEALKLTPEQTAQLFDELARHTLRAIDSQSRAQREGWLNDRDRLTAMDRAAAAEHAERVRDLLGEEGYERLEAYQREIPLRVVVQGVAQRTYFTDEPLTATQSEALASILVRHAKGPQGRLANVSFDWGAALNEAQSVLSATQLAALQVEREQTELRIKWLAMEREFTRQAASAR